MALKFLYHARLCIVFCQLRILCLGFTISEYWILVGKLSTHDKAFSDTKRFRDFWGKVSLFFCQKLTDLVQFLPILDINECNSKDHSHKCDKNTTTCNNKVGSYACPCRNGFEPAPSPYKCQGMGNIHFLVYSKPENSVFSALWLTTHNQNCICHSPPPPPTPHPLPHCSKFHAGVFFPFVRNKVILLSRLSAGL